VLSLFNGDFPPRRYLPRPVPPSGRAPMVPRAAGPRPTNCGRSCARTAVAGPQRLMHWCLRARQTSRRFTFHGETTLLDGYPAENELGDRRWNLSRSYQPEAGRQWPQLDLTTALRAAHRMGQSWTRVFSLIEFGLAIGLTARQQPPREYIPVTISRRLPHQRQTLRVSRLAASTPDPRADGISGLGRPARE
jgi:hypothetical protein